MRAARAQDRGHDVDRRPDAPEAGHEQRHRPVVGAVARRERLRGIAPALHLDDPLSQKATLCGSGRRNYLW